MKKNEELLLREIVKSILDKNSKIPKNKWTLLSTGDERREAVKQELFDLIQTDEIK